MMIFPCFLKYKPNVQEHHIHVWPSYLCKRNKCHQRLRNTAGTKVDRTNVNWSELKENINYCKLKQIKYYYCTVAFD